MLGHRSNRCYDGAIMRTTLAIADGILRELRARAGAESVAHPRTANEVLRAGLAVTERARRTRARFREKPVGMGMPAVDPTHPLEG